MSAITDTLKSGLRGFHQLGRALEENRDLSAEGRAKEKAKLEKALANYKVQAVQALKDELADIRAGYKRVGTKQHALEAQAAAAWDWGRLNYNMEVARAEVRRAQSPAELEKVYAKVLNSGDKHLRRAFAEVGESAMMQRWSSGPEGLEANAISRKMRADLESLTITPEMKAAKEEGAALVERAKEAMRTTRELEAAYPDGGLAIWRGGTEFSELWKGIELSNDAPGFAATLSIPEVDASM